MAQRFYTFLLVVTFALWWGGLATYFVLVLVHLRLDRMLNLETRSFVGEGDFYGVHRLYLWATDVQWLAGVELLASLRYKRDTGNIAP